MDWFEPTSMTLAILLFVLALAAPVALAVWLVRSGRLTGRTGWAVAAGIVVGVLVTQVLTTVGAAVVLNRQFGFYPTWSSMFTGDDGAVPQAVAAPQPLSVRERAQLSSRGWIDPTPDVAATAGGGSYRVYVVRGARTHLEQRVYVWLPPGYQDPVKGRPGTRYPVVTFLGGAYVDLPWVVTNLQVGAQATPLIQQGRIKPFIAVIPDINIAGRSADTECADAPNYPPAYTWLARDVPAWVRASLPVEQPGPHWAVAGWSTGGYCAAKLHLREPGVFGAASSMQGYYAPELDNTTGTLGRSMMRDPRLRELNSPTWLVTHLPAGRSVELLVSGTLSDPQSTPGSQRFLAAARRVPGVVGDLQGSQGHVIDAWRERLPTILPWLLSAIS